MERIDLDSTVSEFNKKYFLNTLNIEGVFMSYDNTVNAGWRAYYEGDRLTGKIYFTRGHYYELSESEIHQILFHEMAHQLASGHGADFQLVMKQYTGASHEETLEFANILKANIEHKAENGKLFNQEMLPIKAQNAFRKMEIAKKREDIKVIFEILIGATASVGFLSGTLLAVLALFMGGFDNPNSWYWVISMIAIPAIYFKLVDF